MAISTKSKPRSAMTAAEKEKMAAARAVAQVDEDGVAVEGVDVAGEVSVVRTVRIDRSEAQLTLEEAVDAAEACGEVRDEVRAIHNQAMGMARQIERPNHMLRREALDRYLRQVENHARTLRAALERLPYLTACIVFAALLTIGASGCGSGCSGKAPVPAAAAPAVVGEPEPVHSCSGGVCK